MLWLNFLRIINLKSPPAIALTCKPTQQMIKKERERKKEMNNKQQQQINLQNSIT